MSVIAELEKLLEPLLAAETVELVDVQYLKENGKRLIRLFVDKANGVSLSDCEAMSATVDAAIEKSGLMKEHYVLEVSSPGLDRVLKKEKDFVRFKGKQVHISLFAPIDGQRNFTGPILSMENGKVKVSDLSGKVVDVDITAIARARLEPEI